MNGVLSPDVRHQPELDRGGIEWTEEWTVDAELQMSIVQSDASEEMNRTGLRMSTMLTRKKSSTKISISYQIDDHTHHHTHSHVTLL